MSTEDKSSLDLSSVADLVEHVHTLALAISQSPLSNKTTAHLAILDFLEVTATLIAHPDLLGTVRLTLPRRSLIYILHFSPSLAVVSRVCDVVATYKRGLATIMSRSEGISVEDNVLLRLFNGLLMDICNCLWRVRAFSSSDTNAQGCHVFPTVTQALEAYAVMVDPDTKLASMFDLSHSPVLCLRSLECIRELEDLELAETGAGHDPLRQRHGGPVTQTSLAALRNGGGLHLTWQEYRVAVLRHLEEKGFVGIQQLMYSAMKILLQKSQSQSQDRTRSQTRS